MTNDTQNITRSSGKTNTLIYTSRYSNKDIAKSDLIPIGISLYPPKYRIAFKVQAYIKELAPTRDMLGLPFSQYELKYLAILESLGVEKIRGLIQAYVPANASLSKVVLLCFEDLSKQDKWCHRRIFANWWEKKTSEIIPEL